MPNSKSKLYRTCKFCCTSELPYTHPFFLGKDWHVRLPHTKPKQCFIAMVCNSKLQALILWSMISVKLNIGKKITGIE